ncbi:MAG: TOBE domain-containing protein, partial [Planctomycetota bacterium]|nr:TOBE domain-containing protein [Planctomycetota bacterium]
PEEISRAPADPDVAGFMRLGSVLHGEAQSVADAIVIELGGGIVVQAKGRASGPVDFLVRSESIVLRKGGAADREPNSFTGRLLAISRAGPVVLADAEIGNGTRIRAAMLPRDAQPLLRLAPGEPVSVSFLPSAVYVFPGSGRDAEAAASG